MTNFESLKESLTRHGQEHLLRFWDELNESERKQLISDIQELNLAEVQSFFKRATASLEESSEKLDDRLKPVPESSYMSISRTSKDQLKTYEEEGENTFMIYKCVVTCFNVISRTYANSEQPSWCLVDGRWPRNTAWLRPSKRNVRCRTPVT